MFKIGEFSRLGRVSVRMLRHYDQLGLLNPAHTDPITKYRYYSAEQLPRLNRIIALRDLGFSLEQIGGLLDEDLSTGEMLDMLRLKQSEVEQRMQAERVRLDRLEARIRGLDGKSDSLAYDVVLRAVEAELVATTRKVVPEDDHIESMFEAVERYVDRHNARADRPPLTIYHDREYRETNIDAEVAVPLRHEIPPGDEVRVVELARLPLAATVVHTGRYATIYRAYNALLDWIQANGYRMTGPVREVYLRYGADDLGFELPPTYLVEGASPFVTELQLPVEKI